MKKLIYFVSALILVSAIVGVGYWLSQRNSAGEQIGGGGGLVLPDEMGGGGELSEGQTPSGNLSEASSAKTIADVFDFLPISENEIVYIKTDGKIMRERGGVLESLNEGVANNLQDSSISKDGSYVFLRFGDKDNPQSSLFSVKDKTWQPLSESISTYDWSPAENSLAYLAQGQSGNYLMTRDFSDPKSKPKKILTLHAKDLWLTWVAKDKILLTEKTSAYTSGSAWMVSLPGATLEQVFPDQLGFRLEWNDLIKKGLVWTGNRAQRGGELLLIGSNQSILQQFEFMTLPDKCAFNTEMMEVATTTKVAGSNRIATSTVKMVGDTYVFCGVPQDQRSFQINPIPDAYDQRLIYTEDNIYKIDVANGSIQPLPQKSPGSIDVKDIKISGKKIFILNRFNNNLIELPVF